jgi:FKBP-type peptidyl-prolyl cis-trans isomerase
VLTPGTGTVHPGTTSTVAMNYTGWTADGKMFDTSFNRGRPKRMPLDKIIRGWSEGLQLMTKGEKARFWIPSRLAFGDRPTQPSAPAGPLVFDVELVDFQ